MLFLFLNSPKDYNYQNIDLNVLKPNKLIKTKKFHSNVNFIKYFLLAKNEIVLKQYLYLNNNPNYYHYINFYQNFIKLKNFSNFDIFYFF